MTITVGSFTLTLTDVLIASCQLVRGAEGEQLVSIEFIGTMK